MYELQIVSHHKEITQLTASTKVLGIENFRPFSSSRIGYTLFPTDKTETIIEQKKFSSQDPQRKIVNRLHKT